MVNRAGNEKAQRLCLLSSFSPCSVAPPEQSPCLLSVDFLIPQICGPYTQRPVAKVQILCLLPKEVYIHACQTTWADFLSSENMVSILICHYVYLLFSFVNLKKSWDPWSSKIKKTMYIITKVNYFQMLHPGSQLLSPSLFSFPIFMKSPVLPRKCFISIVFHFIFP